MTFATTSNQSWPLIFTRSTALLQNTILTKTSETTSGTIHDLGREKPTALSKVAYLDAMTAQTSAFRTVLNDRSMFAERAILSLDTLNTGLAQFGHDMLGLNQSGTSDLSTQINERAIHVIQQALDTLGHAHGDQALFANIGNIPDANTLVAMAHDAVTFTPDINALSQDILHWVDMQFSDVTPVNSLTIIGENTTTTYDSTNAVKAILSSLSSGILATYSGRGADTQALTNHVGETALSAANLLTQNTAQIGFEQERLEQQGAKLSAQDFAWQYNRTELTQVDMTQTAIELQQAQDQLEMMYVLTSRMSRLSLMDYL